MRVTIEGDLSQVISTCATIGTEAVAQKRTRPKPNHDLRRKRREKRELNAVLAQRRAVVYSAYKMLIVAGRADEDLAKAFVQTLIGKAELTYALIKEAQLVIGGRR